MCNRKYNVFFILSIQPTCANISFWVWCSSWKTFNHFSKKLFIENVTHSFIQNIFEHFWCLMFSSCLMTHELMFMLLFECSLFSFFSWEISSDFLYYELCKKSISCNICAQRCNPTIFYLENKMQTLKWLIEHITIFISISV